MILLVNTREYVRESLRTGEISIGILLRRDSMIFHYAGKYDGDESKLPQKEHHPHAVQFREPKDTKKCQ